MATMIAASVFATGCLDAQPRVTSRTSASVDSESADADASRRKPRPTPTTTSSPIPSPTATPTASPTGSVAVATRANLSSITLAIGQSTQVSCWSVDAAGNVVSRSASYYVFDPATGVVGTPVASINEASGVIVGNQAGQAVMRCWVSGLHKDVPVTVGGGSPQPSPSPTATATPTPTPTMTPTPTPTPTYTSPVGGVADLPRLVVDASPAGTPGSGQVIDVPAGTSLQAALDAAPAGATLQLDPGAKYDQVILKAKACSPWTTITTRGADSRVPHGQRVSRSDASWMAKIEIVANGENGIQTAAGACGYRIQGVQIVNRPGVEIVFSMIVLGNGSATSMSQSASKVILDRVYIHTVPNSSGVKPVIQNGLVVNAGHVGLAGSIIEDADWKGAESHCIIGYNLPGQVLIENNELFGSSIPFMIGGADPALKVIPTDIVFRRNWVHDMSTPERLARVSKKNLFETKFGDRWLIEGNVFDGNWADAQSGTAIVLKSSNQDGTCSYCSTTNLTFRYNILRNTPSAISIHGGDAYTPGSTIQTMRNIHLHNNLIHNVLSPGYDNNSGRMFILTDGHGGLSQNVVIEHNTSVFAPGVTGSQAMVIGDGYANPLTGAFRNNVTSSGEYGVFGSSYGWKPYFDPSWDWGVNLYIGNGSVPSLSVYPQTAVGAASLSGTLDGSYRLLSPQAGTDGKTLGADIGAVEAATSGVVK